MILFDSLDPLFFYVHVRKEILYIVHGVKMKKLLFFICITIGLNSAFSVVFASQTPKKISSRIVGGTEADPADWPWMVALVYSGTSSNYYAQFCGASLISSKWVVTAAHCLTDDSGNQSVFPSDLEVLTGAHNLTTGEGERIPVKRIIIHPSYDASNYNNDIALIELYRSSSAETLPLYDGTGDLSGYEALAIGWGNTSPVSGVEDYPDSRMQVTLPVVTNTQCNSVYGGSITDSMMCAGFLSGGKDSCQGDSGGPLIINRNSRWELAGVTSWGEGCAQPGYYGVYARISALKSFIDSYVGSECKILPTSFSLNISNLPATGIPVYLTVSSVSSCNESIYYYYSYAPDYGTDNYDPVNGWVKMAGGDGFTLSKTIGYTFRNPGYYVVVAGMNSERSLPDPLPQIGCTVAVRSVSGSSSEGVCRVTPKSLSLNSAGIPVAGVPVTFSLNAVSECAGPIYYYYSYAPDYGTSSYDPVTGWTKMLDGDGFTQETSVSYSFANPGYYVVTVWTSPQRSAVSPISQIGLTLPVNAHE